MGARYSILPPAAFLDPRLTMIQLRILGILGAHTDSQGWCYLNQSKVGGDISVARETVSRALSGLKVLGYVEIHPQAREDGGRSVNAYRVVIDRPEAFADVPPCDPIRSQPPVTPAITTINDPIKKRPSSKEGLTPSKRVWDLGLELLAAVGLTGAAGRRLVGKWMQTAHGDAEALLSVLEGCRTVGTQDPVSYISAALQKQFPPEAAPPDPRSFDREKWKVVLGVALERGDWGRSWGPPPGAKGCCVPPDMMTPTLVNRFSKKGSLV